MGWSFFIKNCVLGLERAQNQNLKIRKRRRKKAEIRKNVLNQVQVAVIVVEGIAQYYMP